MANISIIKLKIRRGTDTQRKQIVLDQGELGFTTDTNRFFIGDGVTVGGIVGGNKALPVLTQYTSLSDTNAQVGDIVVAQSRLFQLTAANFAALSSWGYIGNRVDDTTIGFNAQYQLQVKNSSISASQLSNNIAGTGLTLGGTTLAVNLNTAIMEFSGSNISIKQGGITQREIATTALSSGLEGGSGTPLRIKAGSGLGFDTSNALVLCSFPSGGVTYSSFDSNSIGSGLTLNPSTQKLETVIYDIDGVSIVRSSNIAQLPTYGVAGNYECPYVTVDSYGITTGIASGIYDTLTGVTTSNADNVPIGTILPHAAAIGSIPPGYLLCNGASVSRTGTYKELFDVIGTAYGSVDGSSFNVPNLSGGQVLYGTGSLPPTTIYGLSASSTLITAPLSSVGANFIIKASSSTRGIFNGSSNQTIKESQSFYTAVDSTGSTVTLSSAGFLTFQGGVTARGSGNYVKRYAIPIFNY